MAAHIATICVPSFLASETTVKEAAQKAVSFAWEISGKRCLDRIAAMTDFLLFLHTKKRDEQKLSRMILFPYLLSKNALYAFHVS